jgi:hypothetical protein
MTVTGCPTPTGLGFMARWDMVSREEFGVTPEGSGIEPPSCMLVYVAALVVEMAYTGMTAAITRNSVIIVLFKFFVCIICSP